MTPEAQTGRGILSALLGTERGGSLGSFRNRIGDSLSPLRTKRGILSALPGTGKGDSLSPFMNRKRGFSQPFKNKKEGFSQIF